MASEKQDRKSRDGINLAEDKKKWLAVVKAVMNLPNLLDTGNIWLNGKLVNIFQDLTFFKELPVTVTKSTFWRVHRKINASVSLVLFVCRHERSECHWMGVYKILMFCVLLNSLFIFQLMLNLANVTDVYVREDLFALVV